MLMEKVVITAHGVVHTRAGAAAVNDARLIRLGEVGRLRLQAAGALEAQAVRRKAGRHVRHALAQAIAGGDANRAPEVVAQHRHRAASRRGARERARAQQRLLAQHASVADRAGAGARVKLAVAEVEAGAIARAASQHDISAARGDQRGAAGGAGQRRAEAQQQR